MKSECFYILTLILAIFGIASLEVCASCDGDNDDDDGDTSDGDASYDDAEVDDDETADDDTDDDTVGEVPWQTSIIDYASQDNRVSQCYVDKAGNVHIAYTSCKKGNCTADNGALFYAVKSASTREWTISVVDGITSRGWYTPVYVDDAGTVHFFYHDHRNGDLRYLFGVPGSWNL